MVVGASYYQYNAWGDLSSVGEDVKAVHQASISQGFQAQTGIDPTEDDLVDLINDFIDVHGMSRTTGSCSTMQATAILRSVKVGNLAIWYL